MMYFRNKRISVNSKEKTEQLLNQSSSKVLSFFDLERINTYVILKERPLAGKRLDSGEVLISRYRHIIFGIVPRIVTKWKVKEINGESYLITKTRLSLLPFMGLLIFLLTFFTTIILSIVNWKLPDLDAFLWQLIVIVIFLLLTRYEIAVTDKIIKKIIMNERIRSSITV
ncbi:MAG TPA: hypothetical protein VL443_18750 [Cyclobacteriaceae bacterium]|nr:hypothetical protein [Cyclobacteriaceae bacterium]